jgi:putative ABC transport system permease protein
MIKFLLQGLLRDKSRSHLPIMVVAVGVMLSVFMHAYITGIMNDTIEMNAAFSYGHVKVLTKGYADNMSQFPNDMALDNTDVLVANLKKQLPNIEWVERIQFGGLIDVPNDKGETVAQGPVIGIGIDLLGNETNETKRLRIHESMVEGRMPSKPSEILVSNDFAKKLGIQMGNTVTLMASTMYGGMAYQNFVVVGTVSFGVQVLDRGTIIADIQGVRECLGYGQC